MQQFLQQMVNGLSLGSIYALIALGYTMVYGIIRLINFAHGDIYMLGAFAGFFAISTFHLSFIPSLIISMAICALAGMLIERVAYKPIRTAPRISMLITAIGVSLFLENGGLIVFSPSIRTFPTIFPVETYTILGGLVKLTVKDIVVLTVMVVMLILLQYLVYRTKIGKAMRAVSFDKDAASLMGVDVDTTISYTFAIGSALAAVAGVLVGIYYNSVWPLMGIMPGLKAFIAAVLGGIGIIPGAVLGGLLIGVIETLVAGYGNSLYRDGVAFAILIIVLLIRPSGLLGKNEKEKV